MISTNAKKLFDEYHKIQYYMFLTQTQKADIVHLFLKNQTLKNTIYKFFFRLRTRIKEKKSMWNSTTMSMDDISSIPPNRLIKINDGPKCWAFDLLELCNTINVGLQISSYMVASPIFPKNPWTNKRLKINELTFIYYRLLENKIQIPIFFKMFRDTHFNLRIMKQVYWTKLTSNAIQNSINEYTNNELMMVCISELHNEARQCNWHTKMRSYPRFDTMCDECFLTWIEKYDNMSKVKGSIYRYMCRANLQFTYKYPHNNLINEFQIDKDNSEYAMIWKENHKKHARKILFKK